MTHNLYSILGALLCFWTLSTLRNFLTFFQEHWRQSSRKKCLYNFDPLKPHFYIVKLGFTRLYIIFLISVQNIDCGYPLELPRRGGSNEYAQSMFEDIYEKYQIFYLKTFRFFLVVKFSLYLNRRVFVMICTTMETICMKCQSRLSRKRIRKVFQNVVCWKFYPECSAWKCFFFFFFFFFFLFEQNIHTQT